ncbi:MAG TPA: twin-arginine translocase TatA/TatE family subunit [Xanthobacteraceae bacterium]|nr:twin-arginine translocase TatA/TatE family subunit [Xanthobacteraceae bacterium]
MGGLSLWHWIIVIAVVLLLFGRGKISELMGDVAQGIKAFKKGMTEDEAAKAEPSKSDPVKTIDHQPTTAGTTTTPDLKNRATAEKKFEGGTV